MLRSVPRPVALALISIVALRARDASSQTRIRAGIGGSISYAHAGVSFAQGEPQRSGIAPGAGFYFHIGAQLSDRTGLYLHGTLTTALLSYTGGADVMIDWALANHRVALGTGIGMRGVATLFQGSNGPPSFHVDPPSGFYSSVIVGVPFTVAVLFPSRDLPTDRRGFRLGLETLTGANLSLQYAPPSLGVQVAVTAGYEWY